MMNNINNEDNDDELWMKGFQMSNKEINSNINEKNNTGKN